MSQRPPPHERVNLDGGQRLAGGHAQRPRGAAAASEGQAGSPAPAAPSARRVSLGWRGGGALSIVSRGPRAPSPPVPGPSSSPGVTSHWPHSRDGVHSLRTTELLETPGQRWPPPPRDGAARKGRPQQPRARLPCRRRGPTRPLPKPPLSPGASLPGATLPGATCVAPTPGARTGSAHDTGHCFTLPRPHPASTDPLGPEPARSLPRGSVTAVHRARQTQVRAPPLC